jgi:flavin-binding protein dodecin
MPEHVYKTIELVGSSSTSIEDAVNNAIGRAGETVRLMRWFQVIETRGSVENNQVTQWQVTVKVGFRLEQ